MIRLAIRLEAADAEIVLAELIELAPSGVEENELPDGRIEYAVYGAAGELPALPDLEAAAAGRLVEILTSEVGDDWDQQWKAFHKPVSIEAGARVLRVRPPWERASAAASETDLVIDPGQAFGTGAHATTRLCLEMLLRLEPSAGCVDLGCGSGVLAIAAAKLGWEPVLGLDHEPESVAATINNASANGVAVAAERFDLRRDGPVPSASLVVANLLLPLLLELANSGFDPEPPQLMIASGLLIEQVDRVSEAFSSAHGLLEQDRRVSGQWASLLLARL